MIAIPVCPHVLITRVQLAAFFQPELTERISGVEFVIKLGRGAAVKYLHCSSTIQVPRTETHLRTMTVNWSLCTRHVEWPIFQVPSSPAPLYPVVKYRASVFINLVLGLVVIGVVFYVP